MVPVGPVSDRTWAPDSLLRGVLDAVPLPLALVDSKGTLHFCNQSWQSLAERTSTFGDLGSLVTTADHEGAAYVRRLSTLEGPLALAARKLSRALQDAVAGRPHDAQVSYRARRPDGEIPFDATVVPLPGTRFALVMHVDVADRERAADAEAVALKLGLEAEALRTGGRALKRRLSALSRDLHTPLTPVRLELHLLASGALGALGPDQARALAIVTRNVQRLADGEQSLTQPPELAKPVDLDLAALARHAVEARQTEALQQGIQLELRAPRAIPVHAHAEAVRDALDRFLDHALSTTPAGGAVAVETRAHGNEALVEVRDSGPGWSAREVKSAFEPWAGKPLRPDGPGLLLPFARHEVEADGGRAWAESDGISQGVLLGLALPLLGPGGFRAEGRPAKSAS